MLQLKRSRAVLLLFICGCISVDTSIEFVEDTDFSQYRTYGWKKNLEEQPVNPGIDRPLLEARVKKAVDLRMSELNFEKVTSETPDMYIGYHADLEKRIEISRTPDYYGAVGEKGYLAGYRSRLGEYGKDWGRGSFSNPPYEYDLGTLVLDMIDAKTGKLIWRGTAWSEVNLWATERREEQRINKAVGKILSDFPPD